MARLIPKIAPEDISNVGERDVAMALVDQLPDDCVIYHSFPWLRADRHDRSNKVTLREGEADFVIVHPKAGMLILEVKGGEIQYDNENRKWYRQERHRTVDIKDPFEQARKNAHALEQQIRRKAFQGEKDFPCPYGYAVAFPHCEFEGDVPPGANTSMVFSALDLEFLGQRVTKLLGLWKHQHGSVNLTKQQMSAIQLSLSSTFQLLPILFRRVQEQEERLHRLTEDQVRILDVLGNHNRAAIKGVAGSGKTMLAIAQAQRFAREGKKTLLVCFNISLAEWLTQNQPDELKDSLKIDTFHGICKEFCQKANISFQPPQNNGAEFWEKTTPELLMQALDFVPDRFDAVVVDEGQDFHPDWWFALELINSDGENGAFYIFYDPAQNLFVEDDSGYPDLGRPFELPTNCRNTRNIASMCSKIRGIDIPVRPDAPDGIESVIKTVPKPEGRAKKISEIVSDWTGKGKLKPSQIAILSHFTKRKSCLAKTDQIGKTAICSDVNDWRNNEGILFATIRSFKGLEADAIIVTDVRNPESSDYFSDSEFYVGCSRAKHMLVILAMEKIEM